MKSVLVLLCIMGQFQTVCQIRQPAALLDREDAWLLVMNIPDVMGVEARKGCPQIELTPEGEHLMSAMVRNECPDKLPASGTVGLYTVDLRDGRIWRGVDPVTFIDSERLQRLRRVLLSRQRLKSQIASPK